MASDGKVARDGTLSGDVAGPQRVRDATIEVSGRLFAQRGIHAVSVREIAREVGVSHTLLHLYFGSKDEIVRQVLSRCDHCFAEQLENASSPDTAVADTFRSVAHDREFARVLAAALVEGVVPGQVELEGRAQSALVRRIAQKTADQPQSDPRVVAAMLGAIGVGWSVAGEWLSEASGFEKGEQEDVMERMAALMQRMVGECL